MVGAKMEQVIKKILNRKSLLVVISLLVIIFFGGWLRSKNYATVPHPGETADEYCYGWLGLSLIIDRYPSSWSALSAYYPYKENRKIDVDLLSDMIENQRPAFPIVKPWFDSPPFFGFVTGGYAYLKGARSFADTSIILLRRPMLKIALLTTVLIFILATQLFNVKVGLLSAFLYSVVPSVVISSRLAITENGYIPLYLGSLILANLYLKKSRTKYWFWANVLAAVAVLFKLSALSIAVTLILIAFLYGKKDRNKLVLISLAGAILPLMIFCLFGAYYDWHTFINIFLVNSKRFYGASSEIFYSAVVLPKIARFFTDGWLTMGWIAAVGLSLIGWQKEKGAIFLTLYFFSHLVIFLVLGSESYGWYRFPFYPFLMIAIARVFVYFIEVPNIFAFLTMALLPFGTTIHKLIGVDGFQQYILHFRLFVLTSLAFFVLPFIIKKKLSYKIQQIFTIIVICLLCYWSVREVLFYTYDKWFFAT